MTAHSASLQRGYRWTASSRDQAVPPMTGISGRIERGLQNFLETFPFFVCAVLIAHLLDLHNTYTEAGALLYFWGRIIYLPLYAFGVRVLRSIAWNVAMIGIIMIIVTIFVERW
ncbi:MAG: MAPEG family protein [Usitatibacteraceae bacterium]